MGKLYIWLKRLTIVLAAATLGLMLFSGFSQRFGWVHYREGLKAYRWSVMLSMPTLLCGVLLIAIAFVLFRSKSLAGTGRKSPGFLTGIIAVLVGTAIFAAGSAFKTKAQSVPPIHDITTDTENPPQFQAILPLREGTAENPAEYAGPALAAEQKQAYPDIEPLTLAMPKTQAFQRAVDAVKNLGWELVDSNEAEGRIEAYDKTLFFGFVDDVVIRLTEVAPGETKLDIRSLSRVGISDVGANAARIRKFIGKVK